MQQNKKRGGFFKTKNQLKIKKNENGAISIPCMIFFAVFFSAGIGMFAIEIKWRKQVENQLIIDRCVAHYSLSVKNNLNEIESINKKIKWNRALLLVSTLTPAARKALSLSLNALVLLQKIKIATHKKTQLQWLTHYGCHKKTLSSLTVPIKNLPWIRPPKDILGPQALKWSKKHNFNFWLQMNLKKRSSAATIGKNSNENKWYAKWEKPILSEFNSRTDFY